MKINAITPTDEVSKYLKKKESDVSHAKKKSKHKHIYADCLLKALDNKDKLYLGRYCTICGKIDDWSPVWDIINKNGYICYTILPDEEVFKKYGHLPQFEVEHIYTVKEVEV